MTSKKVLCLGGYGDPISIGNAIINANMLGYCEYEFSGLLNDFLEPLTKIDGTIVLGSVKNVQRFIKQNYYIINGIHRIDGNLKRIKMIEKLKIKSEKFATFIHPTAYIAPGVEIGPGSVIMPNVSISHKVKIGKNCIVLQGATIGHNTKLSDYCHVSAQACVGANIHINKGVHIGMNSTVLENISIGKNSTIGMGSVLTHSIMENEIWFGVPAQFLRKPGIK